MEQVIAYKANDGKLFLDASACSDYEAELKKYPIVSESREFVSAGIVKVVETIKKSKYAAVVRNVWYEVGNKYKFRNVFREDMFNYPDRVEFIFADKLLNGHEMSVSLCHHIFGELLYDSKHRGERWGLEDGTVEGEIWRFSDVRWHGGQVRPDLIEISMI